MNLNSIPQRVALASAGAVVVLLAAFYLAVWSPQGHKLKAAHAATGAAQSQAAGFQQQVLQLQALAREIPSDKSKLAGYTTAVPDNPQLPAALDDIQAAAQASGVTLSSIGPSTPATGSSSGSGFNGVPSISVSLSTTGAYQQVMAFVTALNKMPRTLVMTGLNLSGGGTQGSVSASISADIFYAGKPTP